MSLENLTDSSVVNVGELAQLMRVSRWSIASWRKQGYAFEFGNRTTPGHLKSWLRERALSERKVNVNAERSIADALAGLN